MTTAARPTFEPARGGRGKGEGDLSQLSKQYSSRDLPSHTKIKCRQTTQDTPEDMRICDFRRELEDRESCCCKIEIEIGPPENTQPPLQCQRSSIGPDPAAKLDVDHPLREEEDEDFEEECDGDDTVALPAELEKNSNSKN